MKKSVTISVIGLLVIIGILIYWLQTWVPLSTQGTWAAEAGFLIIFLVFCALGRTINAVILRHDLETFHHMRSWHEKPPMVVPMTLDGIANDLNTVMPSMEHGLIYRQLVRIVYTIVDKKW
jgi:hypothetical protein